MQMAVEHASRVMFLFVPCFHVPIAWKYNSIELPSLFGSHLGCQPFKSLQSKARRITVPSAANLSLSAQLHSWSFHHLHCGPRISFLCDHIMNIMNIITITITITIIIVIVIVIVIITTTTTTIIIIIIIGSSIIGIITVIISISNIVIIRILLDKDLVWQGKEGGCRRWLIKRLPKIPQLYDIISFKHMTKLRFFKTRC